MNFERRSLFHADLVLEMAPQKRFRWRLKIGNAPGAQTSIIDRCHLVLCRDAREHWCMSTTCANNMSQGKRRKLEEFSACELEPLEAQFTERWPEVWREIARSCYLTLLALPAASRQDNAELSMHIAEGLGADLGGSQPYIPVGCIKDWDARKNRVLEMLARGDSYKSVARECGLTESSVRRIEGDQRRKRVPLALQIATHQSKPPK